MPTYSAERIDNLVAEILRRVPTLPGRDAVAETLPAAIASLDPPHQRAIVARWLTDPRPTYRQIAGEFGLSNARIPIIESDGLRKLANAVTALLAKAAVLAKPDHEKEAAALDLRIKELNLSARSANCLHNERIVTVRDLVKKTEGEMLRIPNFARVSLAEIKAVLGELGLKLAPPPTRSRSRICDETKDS